MTFCVLFVIFGAVLGQITFQSPYETKEFKTTNAEYSIANFGHIPYGKKMSALLFVPPGENNEQEKAVKLCESPIIRQGYQIHQTTGEKWLIVRRGDCPFTRKAIIAQNLEAKLLIIVDNKDEKVDQIMMADDGNGYQVDIPSVLIPKKEGDYIINYLQQSYSRYLVAHIEFKLDQSLNQANVLFGLNIENKDTFRLINEFRPIYLELKDYIKFSIFYEVLRCFNCEKNNWQTENADCLGGGRYCQFDPNGVAFGTGSDVLKEQLRQTCIWQDNPERWWSYMNYFTRKCTKENEFDKCFETFATPEEKINIEKCITASYVETTEPLKGVNTILEDHFKLRYQSGIIFYPGVSINSVAYRGNIEASEIKEAICATFKEAPSTCQDQILVISPNRQVEDSYFWLVIVVITSSVLFILFIVFIYRRNMKKQMEKQIRDQVGQQVNNYVRFYESRSEK